MDFFFAILFFVFVALLGILPFFLVYTFSSFMGYLISRVIRYRRDVVEDNIRRSSLPEMDSNEFGKLVNTVYKNMTDVLIEGIKGFTMSDKTLFKRYKILNPEVLDPYFEKSQSVMGVLGHYNNWEWGSLAAAKQLKHKIVALYKPLSNKRIDKYAIKIRARYGTELASIFKTSLTFKENVNNTTLFLLVADQSPSNERRAYWVDFMGRQTAFLHGPEMYAKKNNLPVIFIDIQREKRGCYEVKLVLLADDPNALEDGEITRRYAKALEKQILKNPENWLWTHRRWKLTKE